MARFGWFLVALAVCAVCALWLSGCSGDRFGSGESWQTGGKPSELSAGTTGGQSSRLFDTGGQVSASTGGTPAQSSTFGPSTGGEPSASDAGTTGGSGPSAPCDGICDNPTRFVLTAGNFTSPPLGTGESCWETFNSITRGIASNFVARSLLVNGSPVSGAFEVGPARAAGWCVYVGSGDYSYANFQVF
jgi:hypothetical protein